VPPDKLVGVRTFDFSSAQAPERPVTTSKETNR
jgi:hypothetical protein